MIIFPKELTKKHLRTFYQKGDVLFWENFPGEKRSRDSHFVLLTNCINDKFIVVRATAQTHYYSGPSARRIAHEVVFIKSGETSIFSEDTILDLNWMDTFSIEELYKMLGSNIKKRGMLSSDIIKRIDDSVLIATTVSSRNKKLILRSF